MPKVIFRNYEVNDYSAVKAILEEGSLFEKTWDTEERLRKRIKNKNDSILVATINNEVIATVYLIDDVLPFIFRLAVKTEYRKQGIGKKLVEEAIKRMKEHGHNEIAIFVDERNDELKEWYKKQGFKAAGVWRCMWKAI